MNQILLFIGLVIILCLTIKPVGKKLPFPTLLIFIALGMLLGVNGPAHIDFSDYALTETVCSTALLFIMFYGGFNTNIDRAKPVAAPAVLLSTLGVVITAGITGVFAHFVLGFDWIGGLLLGVIEALAAGYIAIAWKDAIAFTVLILILIIRPTGILGERTADKL